MDEVWADVRGYGRMMSHGMGAEDFWETLGLVERKKISHLLKADSYLVKNS